MYINLKLILFIFILLVFNSIYAALKFKVIEIYDTLENYSPVYNFTFKFFNEGETPIEIIEIKTSCSCTVPTLDKKIFQPNESGEIKGILNIGNRVGLQKNEITVYTNDISKRKQKLFLNVNVINPIEVKPFVLFWTHTEDLSEKIIRVNINNEEWRLSKIIYDESLLNLKAEDANKNGCEIKVTPLKRAFRDVIEIAFTNKKSEIKNFIVHVLVK